MDLDLELQPELDPAALELLPAEHGLTGCPIVTACQDSCTYQMSCGGTCQPTDPYDDH